MFLRYSEDHTLKVYRFLNLNMKKIVYHQDVQWMDIMYGEHTGIKHKSTINQDYLTHKEESEEEVNPVQLNVDETILSEEEKTETVKDEPEMPPGEAQNLEWMANLHPGTKNIVGYTRSEDLSMKENLNWCTTEHYLSDYCLMMHVNLVNLMSQKFLTKHGTIPILCNGKIGRKQLGRNFPS